MSLQQPLYSAPQLFFAILNKKKVPLEQFEPFSIQIENLYANDKQLFRFTSEFGEPDDIPTFAFITAFKASLQCLSQAKIPSSIMGLIHISSEFQLHNNHNWLMPFNIKLTVNQCHQSDKGLMYTITTDFYQRGLLTITNINQMLDKSRKYSSNKSATPDIPSSEEPKLIELENWPITQKTAWRYVRISGDVNPIHLHPILAKQFGLPNVLIHGMYNASKTLQEMKKQNISFGQRLLIEFNRPCFIPNSVHLKQYEGKNEFALFSSDGNDRFLKLTTELELTDELS